MKSYRIINPFICLGSLAALFFLPIIRLVVASGLASSETKTNLVTTIGLKEYNSFYDMINMTKTTQFETIKKLLKTFIDKKGDTLDLSNMKFLYAALVFLVIVVLLLLAVTVLSIVMKKNTIPLLLTGCTVLSAVVMNACFKAFAKPFLDGRIGVSSLFGSSNAALGSLFGALARVENMELSTAYSVLLFLLAASLIFGFCVKIESSYSKK